MAYAVKSIWEWLPHALALIGSCIDQAKAAFAKPACRAKRAGQALSGQMAQVLMYKELVRRS